METVTFMDALFIEGINTFRIAAFFSTAKAVLKINSFKHFFLCKEGMWKRLEYFEANAFKQNLFPI